MKTLKKNLVRNRSINSNCALQKSPFQCWAPVDCDKRKHQTLTHNHKNQQITTNRTKETKRHRLHRIKANTTAFNNSHDMFSP